MSATSNNPAGDRRPLSAVYQTGKLAATGRIMIAVYSSLLSLLFVALFGYAIVESSYERGYSLVIRGAIALAVSTLSVVAITGCFRRSFRIDNLILVVSGALVLVGLARAVMGLLFATGFLLGEVILIIPMLVGFCLLLFAPKNHVPTGHEPTTIPASAPAAWHPDPWIPNQLRWWDGAAWTEQVSLPPGSASAAPVAPPGVPHQPEVPPAPQGRTRIDFE